MIKSGDFFLSGKTGGVIGAVVPWRGAYAGIAPAHIFHYAGTDFLRVGKQSCKVAFIPGDADLAFFPIPAACEPTKLGKPPWARLRRRTWPARGAVASPMSPGPSPTSFSRPETFLGRGIAERLYCRMARLSECFSPSICIPTRGLPYRRR